MFWLVSVWSKLNNHKKIVGQKSLKILAFIFEIANIFANCVPIQNDPLFSGSQIRFIWEGHYAKICKVCSFLCLVGTKIMI